MSMAAAFFQITITQQQTFLMRYIGVSKLRTSSLVRKKDWFIWWDIQILVYIHSHLIIIRNLWSCIYIIIDLFDSHTIWIYTRNKSWNFRTEENSIGLYFKRVTYYFLYLLIISKFFFSSCFFILTFFYYYSTRYVW
jgi:hypothetical protein